jgi:arylsulfatase A-like enzyme
MLGSEGRRLKRKPWEESIRVPGILRCPSRIKAGSRSEAIFTHVDFAPTWLGLCGLKAPAEMQGADLSGVVLGHSSAAPDSAFFQIFGPFEGDGTEDGWRGVRTHRYMYARFESKPWVLYDLEKDPYEMHNLIRNAALVAEMDGRLTAWMKRTGDSWKLDWHELVEDKGRLYNDGTYYSVDEYLKAANRPKPVTH